MSRVTILGSSNSIPDEKHENTHFVVETNQRTLLIDCSGNPIVRLHQAEIDYNQLTDLILTHFHPDHVSGVPLLLMDMWLMGRQRPLNIYGLHHTVDRMEANMQLYNWGSWPDFFPVVFHRLPSVEMTPVITNHVLRVFASPVQHLIPAIGLRIEFTRQVIAYSCDTEPCPQVVRLAAGADILIHEATGQSTGHSSAAQAGEIARQAGAKSLYLIHYPGKHADAAGLIAEAQAVFPGQVCLAEDFSRLEFE